MGKATRKSALELQTASRTIGDAMKKTWRLAPKAPMFTRKTVSGTGKRKVTRTNRLIGSHTFKILASGAAQYTARVLAHEANALRISIGSESKRCPWLPAFSRGAISMMQGFVCAYAQEGTRNAVNMKKALGRYVTDPKTGKEKFVGQKRLNGKLMKMGYDTADESIFGSCAMVPRHIMICRSEKKAPGKKNEDGSNEDKDYVPPVQADDNAETNNDK
jgi:hypothetical protein